MALALDAISEVICVPAVSALVFYGVESPARVRVYKMLSWCINRKSKPAPEVMHGQLDGDVEYAMVARIPRGEASPESPTSDGTRSNM